MLASGDQAGELKEQLVGEVEVARKDAHVVAMTREEAGAQLAALEARLQGLREQQQELKVRCCASLDHPMQGSSTLCHCECSFLAVLQAGKFGAPELV